MPTTRKDYASGAIVKESNETIKRVNFMNTPHSVQQTGVNHIDGRLKVVDTAAKFNTLTTRQRVLNGCREGYLKTVTADTSLVFVFLDSKKNPIETTLTMAQVIASGELFFIDEKA